MRGMSLFAALLLCGCNGEPTPTDMEADTDTDTDTDTDADTDTDTDADVTVYSDVQPILADKCATCHTTGNSGGHNIGTDGSVANDAANSAPCTGLTIAECAIQRIQNGSMPAGAGCSGDPVTDAGSAACLTQAEQDMIQDWIDDGAME